MMPFQNLDEKTAQILLEKYNLSNEGELIKLAEEKVYEKNREAALCALAFAKKIMTQENRFEKMPFLRVVLEKIYPLQETHKQPNLNTTPTQPSKEAMKEQRRELYLKMKRSRKAYMNSPAMLEKKDIMKARMKLLRRKLYLKMKERRAF